MRTRDFDKQKRIKDAMISLILKEGINGASVGKIAREAGVSPATIYVYYESKEHMLAEVFSEYVQSSFRYLSDSITPDISAADLIEAVVRATYQYAQEHEEIFSFVEQCSCCPTIRENFCPSDCCKDVYDLIHAFQKKGVIRPCSDMTITAALYGPVNYMVAHKQYYSDPDAELDNLIGLLQRALLY